MGSTALSLGERRTSRACLAARHQQEDATSRGHVARRRLAVWLPGHGRERLGMVRGLGGPLPVAAGDGSFGADFRQSQGVSGRGVEPRRDPCARNISELLSARLPQRQSRLSPVQATATDRLPLGPMKRGSPALAVGIDPEHFALDSFSRP